MIKIIKIETDDSTPNFFNQKIDFMINENLYKYEYNDEKAIKEISQIIGVEEIQTKNLNIALKEYLKKENEKKNKKTTSKRRKKKYGRKRK